MCKECGCDSGGGTKINGKSAEEVTSPLIGATSEKADHSYPEQERDTDHDVPSSEPDHAHSHNHGEAIHDTHSTDYHHHNHSHQQPHNEEVVTIQLNRPILEANDRVAERNRGYFLGKGIFAINMLSSPGSGKTTLIYETAKLLSSKLHIAVIVGDLATQNDAEYLRKASIPVVQINTGTACHLDAEMVARAMSQLAREVIDLLIIENVGNLVCPAMFDLGENQRIVLLSTTEGEDKPLKYPPLFHSANVAIITKIDLAQTVGFNRQLALENLKKISHHAEIFELSARTGAGMDKWCQYLLEQVKKLKP
ncbi:MAG: hydrogenase nickel incorporation protein HypB [Verrucomicrobiia bacterium]